MSISDLIRKEGNDLSKARGEHIFTQGDHSGSLYYVHSGLLKAYYIGIDGSESVKSFIQQGDIIGSLKSAYVNEPCSFSLVCLEPSVLYEIPLSLLRQHAANDLIVANQVIELLINFGIKKEKREFEFLCLNAEERFRILLDNSPELLERVTQNDIARYLGITPVGLSRIKKRVTGADK